MSKHKDDRDSDNPNLDSVEAQTKKQKTSRNHLSAANGIINNQCED